MRGFDLSKWYADCVSECGDAAIVYHADLRWGGGRTPLPKPADQEGGAHCSSGLLDAQAACASRFGR